MDLLHTPRCFSFAYQYDCTKCFTHPGTFPRHALNNNDFARMPLYLLGWKVTPSLSHARMPHDSGSFL